jgi:hypothetical protein
MESNMVDSNYERYNELFRNLMNAYVEPDEAFKFIGQEMANDGIQGDECNAIKDELIKDFFPDSQFAHDDFDDAQFSDLDEGYGNDAKVHDLRGMDHGDVYDQTQTDDNISDGDVIIADNATAVMCKAWPVLVSGRSDVFHTLKPGRSFTDYENGRYEESEMLAQHLAQENGIVEESVEGKWVNDDDLDLYIPDELIDEWRDLFSTMPPDEYENYVELGNSWLNSNHIPLKLVDCRDTGDNLDWKIETNQDQMHEDFNLQNGYDDINCANGDDYFPNGADSPVVRSTGPSGARQGDNPEQKKMQVAETHKELVYAYRNFLKESKKK